MSAKFSMDDYVDVAERVRRFAEKYPEGSLQSEVEFVNGGVLCKAFAFRSATDEKPGVGHAFEPIPGKTPYTRDSEVMNAETSAWGRAIVALGFETKKIASADEVRARSGAGDERERKPGSAHREEAGSTPAPDSPFQAPTGARGKGPDVEKLRSELLELVTQLGATDSLKAVHEHADAGDTAWLKRQIKTAKEAVAKLDPVPF